MLASVLWIADVAGEVVPLRIQPCHILRFNASNLFLESLLSVVHVYESTVYLGINWLKHACTLLLRVYTC